MIDLIDWVIEESKRNHVIYINGKLTSSRRFPPYNTVIIHDSDKYFKVTDCIKIYNRKLTEDEWNHLILSVSKKDDIPFDGEKDYIEIPNKWHFKVETITPAGHNVIINFGEKTLIVDGEIYFTTESFNYYPIALSPDEILSDYYQEEKGITLRWARKNEGHLKLKKKTDMIVIDWKNIRYWIR